MQTVEGQKKKLEESEQLLNQRRSVLSLSDIYVWSSFKMLNTCLFSPYYRDLIANYRKSVDELVKSEP